MAELSALQRWVADVITTPLVDSCLDARHIKPAEAVICPSPTLAAHERIEIYNQQYWWRLYNALGRALPTVLRLFGTSEFIESLAQPFLERFAPNHWSLYSIAQPFCEWLERDYCGTDRDVVVDAARLDWLFHDIFLRRLLPFHPDPATPMCLQPHVELVQRDWDWFHFRDQLLQQDSEYWLQRAFPPLVKKECFAMLFRSPSDFRPHWQLIDEPFFRLLQRFRQPTLLEDALGEGPIQEWFGTIGQYKLLCHAPALQP